MGPRMLCDIGKSLVYGGGQEVPFLTSDLEEIPEVLLWMPCNLISNVKAFQELARGIVYKFLHILT